jgi:dTDP-4-dehydrorhamnose 3,5-epimerase
MIEGVKIKKLKRIEDERGYLMEILRKDDDLFEGFGQVYITMVKPHYAKAWHMHEKQTDHFVCIKGNARVVLCDKRKESKTFNEVNEFILGEKNRILLKIPMRVMHGFESVDENEAVILNIPTKTYNYGNPDEIRLPFNSNEINFKWKAKRGG